MSQHQSIPLSTPERDQLQQLISAGNAPTRVQTPARILLLTDHSTGKHKTTQQTVRVALHSGTGQLAQHRRVRTVSVLSPMFAPSYPRLTDLAERGGSLGGGAQFRSSHRGMALYNQRRKSQTQKTLPSH